MVLNDDRDQQAQRKWHSRIAQERLDLSASVEKTLEESSPLQWQEDEQDSAMYTAQHVAHGASLIPPRLSLQSKAMPAVHPGSFIEAASSMHPALSGNAEMERKPVATTQNANMLVRLAQRLTSSLAAFGSALHTEGATMPSAPLSGEVEMLLPSAQSAEEVNRVVESTELPMRLPKGISEESAAWIAMPGWSTMTAERAVVQGGVSGLVESKDGDAAKAAQLDSAKVPTPLAQTKQRLAGHTTKVRLQTANSIAAARPIERPVDASERGYYEARKADEQAINTTWKEVEVTGMRLAAVDVWGKEIGITSARLPTVDVLRQETGETSIRMPVVNAANRVGSAILQKPVSGSGVFEYGQNDVIVTNSAITAASVVVVTLTSNPGPVVVQYVSLQPRLGFTVHLTAPTTARTTFNYIILEGETP